jgi:peptide-methionine (S)-S-oxide reductase
VKHLLVGAALAATLLATPATAAPVKNDGESIATFAGGCFWCTESDFEKVPGVISAVSGYTGGRAAKPTYEQVSQGGTGHAESVQVRFDPAKVSYEQLLKIYWHSVDPTVKDRQFCDSGAQYRTAIFAQDAGQQRQAEASKAEVEKQLGVPVYTEIVAAGTFYPAEDYHQDYYKKNPIRYKFYRANCGRDARLEQVWGPKKAK